MRAGPVGGIRGSRLLPLSEKAMAGRDNSADPTARVRPRLSGSSAKSCSLGAAPRRHGMATRCGMRMAGGLLLVLVASWAWVALVAGVLPIDLPSFSDGYLFPKYTVMAMDGAMPALKPGQRVMPITLASWMRFQCVLPAPGDSAVVPVAQAEAKHGSPADLLLPLLGKCFVRKEGWWTFEVCHPDHVRQFHQDEAGEVSEEYVLGSARGGGPLTVEVEPTKGSSQHDSSQVLSFSLGQGTPCDLTGRPREAKVTYSCSHSDMTVLQSVREDATCKYELEMTTSLLCGDSRFAPPLSPTSRIVCYPANA